MSSTEWLPLCSRTVLISPEPWTNLSWMPWQWHSSICMVLDFFLPRYFGAFGFSPSGFLYIDQVSFLEFWASCSYPQVLATWPPVLLPYSCQPTEILFSTLRGCW